VTDGLSPVVLLDESHDVSEFGCGKPVMDEWLRKYALRNQGLNAARTYVTCEGTIVRGYFSLAPSSIAFKDAPERIRAGLARYPVPVVLLAKLAVDQRWRGRRIGESLLFEALQRSLKASKAIAGVAVLVDALDEEARTFYERYDFEQSPTDSNQLLLLMSDIALTFS
jgi:GNAT superfamily N-acetyltransferase